MLSTHHTTCKVIWSLGCSHYTSVCPISWVSFSHWGFDTTWPITLPDPFTGRGLRQVCVVSEVSKSSFTPPLRKNCVIYFLYYFWTCACCCCCCCCFAEVALFCFRSLCLLVHWSGAAFSHFLCILHILVAALSSPHLNVTVLGKLLNHWTQRKTSQFLYKTEKFMHKSMDGWMNNQRIEELPSLMDFEVLECTLLYPN